MCNAWNHPPSCRCGFGGDVDSGSHSYGKNSLSPESLADAIHSKTRGYQTNEALTRPCRCPWNCGSQVFYHTNGNGDSVYFDSLGQPWEIHSCFKKYWEQEKKYRTFQPFGSSSINDTEQLRRLLVGAIQDIKGLVKEDVVANQMGLTKSELRKHYGRFYRLCGSGKSEKRKESEHTNSTKGTNIGTSISLSLLEATFGCEKTIRIHRKSIHEVTTLKILIPAGVDSHVRLRVSGYGEMSENGGTPGDLYVHVAISSRQEDHKSINYGSDRIIIMQ